MVIIIVNWPVTMVILNGDIFNYRKKKGFLPDDAKALSPDSKETSYSNATSSPAAVTNGRLDVNNSDSSYRPIDEKSILRRCEINDYELSNETDV